MAPDVVIGGGSADVETTDRNAPVVENDGESAEQGMASRMAPVVENAVESTRRRTTDRAAPVIVIGGGPAGLAAAIRAALSGVDVEVFERRAYPLDKACGEGVLPAGLEVLRRLGVTQHLDPRDCSPIVGIRYVQEDDSFVEGRLPAGGGLGIRRTALSQALYLRARALGIPVHERRNVVAVTSDERKVRVHTDQGVIDAGFVIAADGLASPIRGALGMGGAPTGGPRFGLRQHFRHPPWSDHVEVHLASGVEAYVTPTGANRIGVAFLFEKGLEPKPSLPGLLARFPRLAERLLGALPDSEPRGAGPLLRPVRTPVRGRVALVGDAAGYVDAVTGEGLSLAFVCAESLGACLPRVLAGAPGALSPFLRTHRRAFRTYSAATHAVLALARRPSLRRPVVRLLGRVPAVFQWALGVVTAPEKPGKEN